MTTAERLRPTQSAQLTNTILMVSPDSFGFNPQTASTNTFMSDSKADPSVIRGKALTEFAAMADLLKNQGIQVRVCPSRTDVMTPDAVFPNNWISFHRELGVRVVLYPMLAPNRRAERQLDAVLSVLSKDIDPVKIMDLTHYEQEGQFLEGTGSLVFDRNTKTVFVGESPRSSSLVLDDFCCQTGYDAVRFRAHDKGDVPIYHTNVVIAVGGDFSVVCLESIKDERERANVEGTLHDLQKDIIPISLDQLHAYCGNVLEVQPLRGRSKIIMSVRAYDAFTLRQRERLMEHGDIVSVNIDTIETIGGGSARCMLAEVFPTA